MIWSFVWLAVLVFCKAGTAGAEVWYTYSTKYLKLKYLSEEDLKKFNRQIDFDTGGSKFSGFFSSSKESSAKGFKKQLTEKLNALIEKVQLILDMRKPVKVNINIYPDKDALHDAYYKIYKKKTDLRAWYIFEHNTIYVNVNDLYSGMLAHECAHAIVDNYMDVRPPRATAEILARYVDSHLNKKAKVY